MEIVLILHARTPWNRQGFIQGQSDIPLDKEGEREAQELAQKLGRLRVRAILSSDLLRCRETATIISDFLNIPVALDRRLRECSFGSLEGSDKETASRLYASHSAETWHGSFGEYDFTQFGGESRAEVLKRHRKALDAESRRPRVTGSRRLIVGHGCALNTLLHDLGLYPPRLLRGEFKTISYP